jgi:hypothetical protein
MQLTLYLKQGDVVLRPNGFDVVVSTAAEMGARDAVAVLMGSWGQAV